MKPLCEAVKVKKWRPQDAEDARTIGFPGRKVRGMKWSLLKDVCATDGRAGELKPLKPSGTRRFLHEPKMLDTARFQDLAFARLDFSLVLV